MSCVQEEIQTDCTAESATHLRRNLAGEAPGDHRRHVLNGVLCTVGEVGAGIAGLWVVRPTGPHGERASIASCASTSWTLCGPGGSGMVMERSHRRTAWSRL